MFSSIFCTLLLESFVATVATILSVALTFIFCLIMRLWLAAFIHSPIGLAYWKRGECHEMTTEHKRKEAVLNRSGGFCTAMKTFSWLRLRVSPFFLQMTKKQETQNYGQLCRPHYGNQLKKRPINGRDRFYYQSGTIKLFTRCHRTLINTVFFFFFFPVSPVTLVRLRRAIR